MKSLSFFLCNFFIVLSFGSLVALVFIPANILSFPFKIFFAVFALIFLYLSCDIYYKNEISKNTDATADFLNSINEKLDKLINNKNPEEKEDKDA